MKDHYVAAVFNCSSTIAGNEQGIPNRTSHNSYFDARIAAFTVDNNMQPPSRVRDEGKIELT